MKIQKPYYPACVIAVLIVLLFGSFTICQVYLLKDTYPVSKLWVGSDYICFYNATQNLLRGVSLYENIFLDIPEYLQKLGAKYKLRRLGNESWYCFPPVPACLNSPLLFFDMETASHIMFFLLLAAVLVAYALINGSFESISGNDRKIIFLCGVIIIVLSHPVYFLIARGHMVGLVFLFLAMGIYLFQRNNPLSSACFGLAIGMMIFPVLILVPLLVFRRYKIFVFTLLSLAVLVILCPEAWIEYCRGPLIGRLYEKQTSIHLMDNCSLAATFNFMLIFLSSLFGRAVLPAALMTYVDAAAFILYALVLGMMAIADLQIWKKHGGLDLELETTLMIMYFPFMIAIPKNSYHYNLVLLLLMVPALCFLARRFDKILPGIILWTLITGIVLSQIQVYFIQNLLTPKHDLFYFFPAFGLVLVMTGCVMFKLWLWRGNVARRFITGLSHEPKEIVAHHSS
jgi:hypothetical protein